VVLAYSYGAPDIRDIHDVGVPRDVHLSDTRDLRSQPNPSWAASLTCRN
jgi:hypothetical protein